VVTNLKQIIPRKITKILSFILCFLLLFEQSGFAQVAAQLDISAHLTALRQSLVPDKFRPLHLRYLSYDAPSNNFKLLLDKGDAFREQGTGNRVQGSGYGVQNPEPRTPNPDIEATTKQLLNYFFVGVSLPNSSFWVNLRPDSPDNIIDDYLAETEVGKILLEADLQLKKDTASATNPQSLEGKQYWDKLYQKAEELFGSENITIPTLTRPWIVPGEIIIRETSENAYIYKATLKVMLEEDYLSGDRGQGTGFGKTSVPSTQNPDPRFKVLNEYSSQLIRELIIPKITQAVNTAKRYAPLRQVYYSLILAQWFKARYRSQSIVHSQQSIVKTNPYLNLIDSKNLVGLAAKEDYSKSDYFHAYQKSFKDGEYKIEEPRYTPFGQVIRSYFSGGVMFGPQSDEAGPGPIMKAVIANLVPGNRKVELTENPPHGETPAVYTGDGSLLFTEGPPPATAAPEGVDVGGAKTTPPAAATPAAASTQEVTPKPVPLVFTAQQSRRAFLKQSGLLAVLGFLKSIGLGGQEKLEAKVVQNPLLVEDVTKALEAGFAKYNTDLLGLIARAKKENNDTKTSSFQKKVQQLMEQDIFVLGLDVLQQFGEKIPQLREYLHSKEGASKEVDIFEFFARLGEWFKGQGKFFNAGSSTAFINGTFLSNVVACVLADIVETPQAARPSIPGVDLPADSIIVINKWRIRPVVAEGRSGEPGGWAYAAGGKTYVVLNMELAEKQAANKWERAKQYTSKSDDELRAMLLRLAKEKSSKGEWYTVLRVLLDRKQFGQDLTKPKDDFARSTIALLLHDTAVHEAWHQHAKKIKAIPEGLSVEGQTIAGEMEAGLAGIIHGKLAYDGMDKILFWDILEGEYGAASQNIINVFLNKLVENSDKFPLLDLKEHPEFDGVQRGRFYLSQLPLLTEKQIRQTAILARDEIRKAVRAKQGVVDVPIIAPSGIVKVDEVLVQPQGQGLVIQAAAMPAAAPQGADTENLDAGKCVTADTLLPILVHSPQSIVHSLKEQDIRLKRIVEVKPGDYVLSLNEETQQVEPHRIKGLLDMGVKQVYKLTTASGRSIKTTANHPYLVRAQGAGYRVQETADGRISEPRTQYPEPRKWTKVSELKAGMEIGAAGKEILAAICPVANSDTLNKDTIVLEIKRNAVFPDAETMSARRQVNQRFGADKRVFQSGVISQFFVNAFLDFAGEALKVAFAARRKLNGIHYANPKSCLTLSNGINPFFFASAIDFFKERTNLGFRGSLDSILSISQPAGFTDLSWYSSVDNLSTNSSSILESTSNRAKESKINSWGTPFLSTITAALESLPSLNTEPGAILLKGINFADFNFAGKSFIIDINITRRLDMSRLFLADAEAAQPALSGAEGPAVDSAILWDKIVSIEPLPAERVYDIEVEGTHNFIGNGIFAHNTAFTELASTDAPPRLKEPPVAPGAPAKNENNVTVPQATVPVPAELGQQASTDIGVQGEYFLNQVVGARTERPVYNLDGLRDKRIITWEEAQPYLQQDENELRAIALHLSSIENKEVTAEEVLHRIIARMEELLQAAQRAEIEHSQSDIYAEIEEIHFRHPIEPNTLFSRLRIAFARIGLRLPFTAAIFKNDYSRNVIRYRRGKINLDEYEATGSIWFEEPNSQDRQEIRQLDQKQEKVRKEGVQFRIAGRVYSLFPYRGGGDYTLIFADPIDKNILRVLRINQISTAINQMGVFYKGEPSEDIYFANGKTYGPWGGGYQWDQNYPTSPGLFYHYHISPLDFVHPPQLIIVSTPPPVAAPAAATAVGILSGLDLKKQSQAGFINFSGVVEWVTGLFKKKEAARLQSVPPVVATAVLSASENPPAAEPAAVPQAASPDEVKKSRVAFEYTDSASGFRGIDLEHFVWAQLRLAESPELLWQLKQKFNLGAEMGDEQVYAWLIKNGLNKETIDLINGSTYPWKEGGPRLEIQIVGQNKNPRAQSIYEAVANSLDAHGFHIGQFGQGVKQIIDWLTESGQDWIDVFTKSQNAQAYQLTILKSLQGQNYISINAVSDEEFHNLARQYAGEAIAQGTIVRLRTEKAIPEKNSQIDDDRRNSLEEISSGIHKRFPFVSAVDVYTQEPGESGWRKVNGFENKIVVVPAGTAGQTLEPPLGRLVKVGLSAHEITVVDNGSGMPAGIIARMFVPKEGSKHSQALGAEEAVNELKKTALVHDRALKHRVSFSRNGEVVVSVDIPEELHRDATVAGGIMLEFALLLEVPESRDNIIIPFGLKNGEVSNFQRAAEHIIQQLIQQASINSGQARAQYLRYINTVIIGLDGLIKENANYEQIIKAIRANTRKAIAPLLEGLRKEGFIILPHFREFGNLVIPPGKQPLFLHEKLFASPGQATWDELGAEVIPGVSLGGGRRLFLVAAPFTPESVKGITSFDREWHLWKQGERIPLIKTERFVIIPRQLGEKIAQLMRKRAKKEEPERGWSNGRYLSKEEEKELAFLLEQLNIFSAEKITTSYEVTHTEPNLLLQPAGPRQGAPGAAAEERFMASFLPGSILEQALKQVKSIPGDQFRSKEADQAVVLREIAIDMIRLAADTKGMEYRSDIDSILAWLCTKGYSYSNIIPIYSEDYIVRLAEKLTSCSVQDILQEVCKLAEKEGGSYSKPIVVEIVELKRVLGEAGKGQRLVGAFFDRIMQSAAVVVEDNEEQCHVLVNSAVQFQRKDVVEAILSQAEFLEDDDDAKGIALAAAAGGLAAFGESARAEEIMKRVMAMAATKNDNYSRGCYIVAVVMAMADSGNREMLDKALLIAQQISDGNSKAEALSYVFETAVRRGEKTLSAKALAEFRALNSYYYYNTPLSKMANTLVLQGQKQEAIALLEDAVQQNKNSLDGGLYELIHLVATVGTMVELGEKERARELVRTVASGIKTLITTGKTLDSSSLLSNVIEAAVVLQEKEILGYALDIVLTFPANLEQRKLRLLACLAVGMAQLRQKEAQDAAAAGGRFVSEGEEEKLWQEQAQPLCAKLIAQAQAAYQPILELAPEEFKDKILEAAAAALEEFYSRQKKLLSVECRFALSKGKPTDFSSAEQAFEFFSQRMQKILQALPGFLEQIKTMLEQETNDTQSDFYSQLFRNILTLGADYSAEIEQMDYAALEVLALGWQARTAEQIAALGLISKLVSSLRDASGGQIDFQSLRTIVGIFSAYAAKDPQVNSGKAARKIESILRLRQEAKKEILRSFAEAARGVKLEQALQNPGILKQKQGLGEEFKDLLVDNARQAQGAKLDEPAVLLTPPAPAQAAPQTAQPYLGSLQTYLDFFTGDTEEVVHKPEKFIPQGSDTALPEEGVEISQIIKLEQQRNKSGEDSAVLSIEELIALLLSGRLPERSVALEADILRNTTVQRESGAYTAEIAQNSRDATRDRKGELVVDFYLRDGADGRQEYVEEAQDNGTGALEEIALIIPKSTKAAGEQAELTGFFGTGKYTIFEGVDRLEIISKNKERAYMFGFQVEKDAAGKPIAIKLAQIRRVSDSRLAQGVTIRRIKNLENTNSVLDRMLSQRAWKTFAGLSQDENFAVYFVDAKGQRKQLNVVHTVLAQAEFKAARPGQSEETSFGLLRVISAEDMPLQILDKAGLRVSEIKEEYLALIPQSLRKFIRELRIVIQIPLPLIRNRSAFEHENVYLPAIQKYATIEFYKAIAYKTLTQTSPQFVFGSLPLDWETNDSYWSDVMRLAKLYSDLKSGIAAEVSAKDKPFLKLLELRDKINRGDYSDIAVADLETLLDEKDLLDKAKASLQLILFLEVAIPQSTTRQSLFGRRMAVQAAVNQKEAGLAYLRSLGYVIPEAKEVPDFNKKVKQAQEIKTAKAAMSQVEKYVLKEADYSETDRALKALVESISRHFGIEQVVLLKSAPFAGSFGRYADQNGNSRRTFFLGNSLAAKLGQPDGRLAMLDTAVNTIVHELAHFLEQLMRDDTGQIWQEGYVAHASDFTHDAEGTFAEAMKYVAAVSLANYSLPVTGTVAAPGEMPAAGLPTDAFVDGYPEPPGDIQVGNLKNIIDGGEEFTAAEKAELLGFVADSSQAVLLSREPFPGINKICATYVVNKGSKIEKLLRNKGIAGSCNIDAGDKIIILLGEEKIGLRHEFKEIAYRQQVAKSFSDPESNKVFINRAAHILAWGKHILEAEDKDVKTSKDPAIKFIREQVEGMKIEQLTRFIAEYESFSRASASSIHQVARTQFFSPQERGIINAFEQTVCAYAKKLRQDKQEGRRLYPKMLKEQIRDRISEVYRQMRNCRIYLSTEDDGEIEVRHQGGSSTVTGVLGFCIYGGNLLYVAHEDSQSGLRKFHLFSNEREGEVTERDLPAEVQNYFGVKPPEFTGDSGEPKTDYNASSASAVPAYIRKAFELLGLQPENADKSAVNKSFVRKYHEAAPGNSDRKDYSPKESAKIKELIDARDACLQYLQGHPSQFRTLGITLGGEVDEYAEEAERLIREFGIAQDGLKAGSSQDNYRQDLTIPDAGVSSSFAEAAKMSEEASGKLFGDNSFVELDAEGFFSRALLGSSIAGVMVMQQQDNVLLADIAHAVNRDGKWLVEFNQKSIAQKISGLSVSAQNLVVKIIISHEVASVLAKSAGVTDATAHVAAMMVEADVLRVHLNKYPIAAQELKEVKVRLWKERQDFGVVQHDVTNLMLEIASALEINIDRSALPKVLPSPLWLDTSAYDHSNNILYIYPEHYGIGDVYGEEILHFLRDASMGNAERGTKDIVDIGLAGAVDEFFGRLGEAVAVKSASSQLKGLFQQRLQRNWSSPDILKKRFETLKKRLAASRRMIDDTADNNSRVISYMEVAYSDIYQAWQRFEQSIKDKAAVKDFARSLTLAFGKFQKEIKGLIGDKEKITKQVANAISSFDQFIGYIANGCKFILDYNQEMQEAIASSDTSAREQAEGAIQESLGHLSRDVYAFSGEIDNFKEEIQLSLVIEKFKQMNELMSYSWHILGYVAAELFLEEAQDPAGAVKELIKLKPEEVLKGYINTPRVISWIKKHASEFLEEQGLIELLPSPAAATPATGTALSEAKEALAASDSADAIAKFIEITPVSIAADGSLQGIVEHLQTKKRIDLAKVEQQRAAPEQIEEMLSDIEQLLQGLPASKMRQLLEDILQEFRSYPPEHVFLIETGNDGYFGSGKPNLLILDKDMAAHPLAFLHEMLEFLKHRNPGIIAKIEELLDESQASWLLEHEFKYNSMGRADYFQSNRSYYVIRAFTMQLFKDLDTKLTQLIKEKQGAGRSFFHIEDVLDTYLGKVVFSAAQCHKRLDDYRNGARLAQPGDIEKTESELKQLERAIETRKHHVEQMRKHMKALTVAEFMQALRWNQDVRMERTKDNPMPRYELRPEQRQALKIARKACKDVLGYQSEPDFNYILFVPADSWLRDFFGFHSAAAVVNITDGQEDADVVLVDDTYTDRPDIVKIILHEENHKPFRKGVQSAARMHPQDKEVTSILEEAVVETLASRAMKKVLETNKQLGIIVDLGFLSGERKGEGVFQTYKRERQFLNAITNNQEAAFQRVVEYLKTGNEALLAAILGENAPAIRSLMQEHCYSVFGGGWHNFVLDMCSLAARYRDSGQEILSLADFMIGLAESASVEVIDDNRGEVSVWMLKNKSRIIFKLTKELIDEVIYSHVGRERMLAEKFRKLVSDGLNAAGIAIKLSEVTFLTREGTEQFRRRSGVDDELGQPDLEQGGELPAIISPPAAAPAQASLTLPSAGFSGLSGEGQVATGDLDWLAAAADATIGELESGKLNLGVQVTNGKINISAGVVTVNGSQIRIVLNEKQEDYAQPNLDETVVEINPFKINQALFNTNLSDTEKQAATERIMIHDIAEAVALKYEREQLENIKQGIFKQIDSAKYANESTLSGQLIKYREFITGLGLPVIGGRMSVGEFNLTLLRDIRDYVKIMITDLRNKQYQKALTNVLPLVGKIGSLCLQFTVPNVRLVSPNGRSIDAVQISTSVTIYPTTFISVPLLIAIFQGPSFIPAAISVWPVLFIGKWGLALYYRMVAPPALGHELTHIFQMAVVKSIVKETRGFVSERWLWDKINPERSMYGIRTRPPSTEQLKRVVEVLFQDVAKLMNAASAHTAGMMAEAMHPAQSQRIRAALKPILLQRDQNQKYGRGFRGEDKPAAAPGAGAGDLESRETLFGSESVDAIATSIVSNRFEKQDTDSVEAAFDAIEKQGREVNEAEAGLIIAEVVHETMFSLEKSRGMLEGSCEIAAKDIEKRASSFFGTTATIKVYRFAESANVINLHTMVVVTPKTGKAYVLDPVLAQFFGSDGEIISNPLGVAMRLAEKSAGISFVDSLLAQGYVEFSKKVLNVYKKTFGGFEGNPGNFLMLPSQYNAEEFLQFTPRIAKQRELRLRQSKVKSSSAPGVQNAESPVADATQDASHAKETTTSTGYTAASQEGLVKNGLVDRFGWSVKRKFNIPGSYNAPNYYIVGIAPMELEDGGAFQCNFLCFYDAQAKVGAVAHVDFNELSFGGLSDADIVKLIAPGIQEMLKTLEKVGVNKNRLQAIIVSRERDIDEFDKLAQRNSNILKKALGTLGVPYSTIKGDSDAIVFNLNKGSIRDGNTNKHLIVFTRKSTASFDSKDDDAKGPPAAAPAVKDDFAPLMQQVREDLVDVPLTESKELCLGVAVDLARRIRESANNAQVYVSGGHFWVVTDGSVLDAYPEGAGKINPSVQVYLMGKVVVIPKNAIPVGSIYASGQPAAQTPWGIVLSEVEARLKTRLLRNPARGALSIPGETMPASTTNVLNQAMPVMAAKNRVEIVGGRKLGIKVRSELWGATSAGPSRSEEPEYIVESFPKKELSASEWEQIAHGCILIEGPGSNAVEILAMLQLFPQLESIYVVDAHYENLEFIQSDLNSLSDVPHARIKLYHADLARLPFGDGYFDFVYSSYTYDSSLARNDGYGWAQELRRVLKDNALFFSEADSESRHYFYDGFQVRKRSSNATLYTKKSESKHSSTGASVSPAPGAETPGGIDLRALPTVTQPVKNLGIVHLGTSLLARGQSPSGTVPSPVPSVELQQIQKMLAGGIIPSSQRIKEFLISSCNSPDCQQELDKALSCIADILRIEEDRCEGTEASLRQMLVLLESDKTAQELRLALVNIQVEEKEPEAVTE